MKKCFSFRQNQRLRVPSIYFNLLNIFVTPKYNPKTENKGY